MRRKVELGKTADLICQKFRISPGIASCESCLLGSLKPDYCLTPAFFTYFSQRLASNGTSVFSCNGHSSKYACSTADTGWPDSHLRCAQQPHVRFLLKQCHDCKQTFDGSCMATLAPSQLLTSQCRAAIQRKTQVLQGQYPTLSITVSVGMPPIKVARGYSGVQIRPVE